MMKTKMNGFTLLEVIISLSIIVIILGVSIPVLGLDMKYRRTRDFNEFVDDLRNIRVISVSSGISHGIKLADDKKGYQIYSYVDKKMSILEVKNFDSDLEVKDSNLKDNIILFSTYGRPYIYEGTNTSGTLLFYDSSGFYRKVTIEPILGRITVYEND